MQTYLEMAQELVFDENILLQTLGMLCFTYGTVSKFECDGVTRHTLEPFAWLELFGLNKPCLIHLLSFHQHSKSTVNFSIKF